LLTGSNTFYYLLLFRLIIHRGLLVWATLYTCLISGACNTLNGAGEPSPYFSSSPSLPFPYLAVASSAEAGFGALKIHQIW